MGRNIAIVTGASSGIGKRIALGVAEQYEIDELWIVARSKDRLEALQEDVAVKVRPIPCDLTLPESVAQIKALLEAEKPTVSVLVNASGYAILDRFDSVSEEENLGMIDLNCRALTDLTYIALPYLTEGSIVVNIASMSSFQPAPYISVYAATKAYVLSFSRALNQELKNRKIRVLAICPYWTQTAFFDRSAKHTAIDRKNIDYIYDPDFIAKTTLKAMKKKRDYVVPGAYAKFLRALIKIFPASVAMKVFMWQQKVK